MAKARESKEGKLQKAFTVERVKDGWSFVTVTYKDGIPWNIVDIERSEPELKSITIEKFKIAAFKYWSSIG